MACVRFKKVTLTSAQIKTLNSVPISVIGAPGAGKAISFVASFARLNFVAPIYSADSQLRQYIDTADSFLAIGTGILRSTFTLGRYFISHYIVSASDLKQIIENKSLMISSSADVTTGNSTITLYIYYRIITL